MFGLLKAIQIHFMFPHQRVVGNVLVKAGGVQTHSNRVLEHFPLFVKNSSGLDGIKAFNNSFVSEQLPQALKQALFQWPDITTNAQIKLGVSR
jgi:hypothetical protein